MKILVGTLLLATALLHTTVAVLGGVGWLPVPGAEGRAPLTEILNDGFLAAVEPDPVRMTVFWFLMFGLIALPLALLMRMVESNGQRLPESVGWWLLGIGLLGGTMIPVSGFWLAVPQGLIVLRRARPRRIAEEAKPSAVDTEQRP